MKDDERVVMASGYFDPLHVGHLEYLEKAKALAGPNGILYVIVNSDEQAMKKKGYSFMYEEDRLKIIRALRCVDEAAVAIDKDMSVSESIEWIRPDIFANGGDRHQGEIPEADICRKLGVEMVDGLGQKIRNSSEIVEKSREYGINTK